VQDQPVNFQRLRLLGLFLLLFLLLFIWVNIQIGGSLQDWIRPQPTLTLFGVFAGFLLLSWQLNKQHQNTIESNKEAARNSLKMEVYRDLATAAQRASSALHKLNGEVMAADMDLGMRILSHSKYNQILSSRHTFEGLSQEVSRANRQVISLMTIMEKWEIALGSDFKTFKEKIVNDLQREGKECRDYFWGLRDFLGLHNRWPPEEEELKKLKTSTKKAQDAVFDVVMDIWDLRIATQNRLLGGLFTYRLPVRKPGDPTESVLTLPEEPE